MCHPSLWTSDSDVTGQKLKLQSYHYITTFETTFVNRRLCNFRSEWKLTGHTGFQEATPSRVKSRMKSLRSSWQLQGEVVYRRISEDSKYEGKMRKKKKLIASFLQRDGVGRSFNYVHQIEQKRQRVSRRPAREKHGGEFFQGTLKRLWSAQEKRRR